MKLQGKQSTINSFGIVLSRSDINQCNSNNNYNQKLSQQSAATFKMITKAIKNTAQHKFVAVKDRRQQLNSTVSPSRRQAKRLNSQTTRYLIASVASVLLTIHILISPAFVHLINCDDTTSHEKVETSAGAAPALIAGTTISDDDQAANISSPSLINHNDPIVIDALASSGDGDSNYIKDKDLNQDTTTQPAASTAPTTTTTTTTTTITSTTTSSTTASPRSAPMTATSNPNNADSDPSDVVSMRNSIGNNNDNVRDGVGTESPYQMKRATLIAADRGRNKATGKLSSSVESQANDAFGALFRKMPYSKYWTAEQKWNSLFVRLMNAQKVFTQMLTKDMLKDLEYFSDIAVSTKCAADLKFIQHYMRGSSNYRWMTHMVDAVGKAEPGILSGNLAYLGHVIQCIKVRAPLRPSNDTFEERYFEKQTEALGERFRGKYCLASIRPVLPEKPYLISRFTDSLLNPDLMSNMSYMGEDEATIRLRRNQYQLPEPLSPSEKRLMDQIPFESELYQYLIDQRNYIYSLPRFMGVCYPSSCTREDVRVSLQKAVDDQHQVVDIEYECEQEEYSSWQYYSTPRLVSMVLLTLIASISFFSSVTRYILVDKMRIRRSKLDPNSGLANLLGALEMLSMDKCAGILFVKTKRASPIVDDSKVENNRSTAIDALKGFLSLVLMYSQLTLLGCLPVPFMWSKWSTAMFPFYQSLATQPFINMSIWAEAFVIISAYIIAIKVLENGRPKTDDEAVSLGKSGGYESKSRLPNFTTFLIKRYIRLMIPMLAFIFFNYLWPRLSNGYVMQDQANKILEPCDKYGWTNMLMFHNHDFLNSTCLWPSYVSASFFQLHILSYPILYLLLMSFNKNMDSIRYKCSMQDASIYASWFLMILFSIIGLVYPALKATEQGIIVPFLIDYIDYDNYRRVIEWTVTPTYNHLTSYMIGIAIAYTVAKHRAQTDSRRSSVFSTELSGTYIHREGSFESAQSSSTQGLNIRIPSRMMDANMMASSYGSHRLTGASDTLVTKVWSAIKSLLAAAVLYLSISASFFWNGYGQPMTSGQTFWYVIATKLGFGLSFAYLFYKHFATRRNSTSPWMITRFLVPVGRMSLIAFYMSYIVLWFDMLTSLYQWHPSHYFIGEKATELIFMILILAMFVYGAFEGPILAIKYARRKIRYAKEMPRFAAMFLPEKEDGSEDKTNDTANQSADNRPGNKTISNEMFTKGSSIGRQHIVDSQPTTLHQQGVVLGGDNKQRQPGDNGKYQLTGGPASRAAPRLSTADQYKLNAELRANYSFASIGLYESAGATGDLEATGDPQTSASSSCKDS